MRTFMSIPLAALLAAGPLAAAQLAEYQATPQSRPHAAPQSAHQAGSWSGWQGCWRIVSEEAPDGQLLCILPGADAAEARLVTLADGVTEGSTTLRVDGVARAVEEGGCTGTETARWSGDGRRIFLRADLMCDGVSRTSTGVLAMVTGNEWVDIQTAAVGEQHAVRILRYRAASADATPEEFAAMLDQSRGLAREAARLHVAAPLQVDDVIEAGSLISTPALQALLAAYGHGFHVDARSIAGLHDAGVAGEVIDVIIALSFPTRFAVRDAGGERIPSTYRQRGYGFEDECYDPFMRRYYYGDACYYGRPFGYGRYGYSPWGYDRYGWRQGTGPVVVIVRPDIDTRPPSPPGSVVKGGGYTRGGTSGETGRGTAQPRSGESSGARATATPSPMPSGTSSGTATSSGSGSSTTGSGDTGRTARPRTSGGGQ
jgi:hypothetical protein